jgi:hypothetical protein
MVNDLMANYLHPGMSYNEIIKFLGKPEDYSDSDPNTMAYEISVDYGKDIDPIKGKNLIIAFSKDSVILNFKVEEWKRQ